MSDSRTARRRDRGAAERAVLEEELEQEELELVRESIHRAFENPDE